VQVVKTTLIAVLREPVDISVIDANIGIDRIQMVRMIMRLAGHAFVFVGVLGTGFAILVIAINPAKVISWIAGLVCFILFIVGYQLIKALNRVQNQT
jgi:hypothetical protein